MKRNSWRVARPALFALCASGAACNSLLGISAHDLEATGGAAGEESSEAGSGAAHAGAASAAKAGSGTGGAHAGGESGANASGEAGQSVFGEGGEAGAESAAGSAGDASNAGGTTSAGGKSNTAGGTSAAGAGGAPVVSCTPACSGGKTCAEGVCQCPAAKPDFCSNTCTDEQSDKLNCGACAHSCGGGSCVGGACQPITLASGRTGPGALAVNAGGVYWLESTAVQAVPLSGGNVVTLASGVYVTGPAGIAASASTVYYTNSGGQTATATVTNYWYALMQVTSAGGAAPSALSKHQSVSAPFGVAMASGTVYWLDEQWESIFKVAEGSAFTASPATVYSTPGGTPESYNYGGYVAVDDSNAYWGVNNGGLFQASLSTGTRVVLKPISGDPHVNQIAPLQGYVYWSTGDADVPSTSTAANSSIYKIPIGGGTISPLASGLSVTPALAADASGVYWDDGDLKRFPAAGGAAVVLAASQNAGFIALDSQFIYWTNPSAGTVMKLAK